MRTTKIGTRLDRYVATTPIGGTATDAVSEEKRTAAEALLADVTGHMENTRNTTVELLAEEYSTGVDTWKGEEGAVAIRDLPPIAFGVTAVLYEIAALVFINGSLAWWGLAWAITAVVLFDWGT